MIEFHAFFASRDKKILKIQTIECIECTRKISLISQKFHYCESFNKYGCDHKIKRDNTQCAQGHASVVVCAETYLNQFSLTPCRESTKHSDTVNANLSIKLLINCLVE